MGIEIFHHTHHFIIRTLRESDDDIPELPEERNPIFFIYPICMLISVSLGVLWIRKRILHAWPEIALAGCATAAFLMLLAGVMEMKHVDKYINLIEVSDDELLGHPVFIHNFLMCIFSIAAMTIYLIEGWVLYDYCRWVRSL